MNRACEGCGQLHFRLTYAAEGPWANRWLCGECRGKGHGLSNLALIAQFKFKLAKLLSPSDSMTVPLVRLMMAVDDVRRAMGQLLEATDRLNRVPELEKYLAAGDHLYAIRRMYSHLHEAGKALRALDSVAKRKVDALLKERPKALRTLTELRSFFNSADYGQSFIRRMRNAIGFHYDQFEVARLVDTYFTGDSEGEGVASEMSLLGRMADQLLLTALDDLAGGDLRTGGDMSRGKLSEAAALAGRLAVVVDHLFECLVAQHPDAVLLHTEGAIEIQPHLRRMRAQLEKARHEEA